MAKVDSIIKENPDLSLDDLVATRKINHDQRAQALKKPALQSSLVQLEEQIAAYRKVEEDIKHRFEAEQQRTSDAHQKELERARDAVKAEVSAKSRDDIRQKLLVLSRFLRAAAARRQGDDEDSDESKAFEGVLLLLYGGDFTAVDAAEMLINGTGDKARSTEGAELEVACMFATPFRFEIGGTKFLYSDERIKQLSLDYAPFAAEEAWVNGVAQAEQNGESNGMTTPTKHTETDPTVANAGLTEANDSVAQATTETVAQISTDQPEQATIDSGAANAAGEDWESKPAGEADQDWASIPRDTKETDVSTLPNTAAPNATANWADDAAAESARAEDIATQPISGDGFHEVHHGRGGRSRGPAGGEFRGRGRGGARGDGFRGRGGFRSDRGRRGGGRGRGRDGMA